MNVDLDRYIREMVPTVSAPVRTPLEPLPQHKHRIIVAKNGTFVEVRRAWLHAVVKLSSHGGLALPFGEVQPSLTLTEPLPGSLLEQFEEHARSRFPNETAAWIVYGKETGYRLLLLDEIQASVGSVKFHRPELDGEELVIDLHSHGQLPAFFSETDDADDYGEVKLAAVVGSLDQPKPTWALRLCLLGLFVPWPDFKTQITHEVTHDAA